MTMLLPHPIGVPEPTTATVSEPFWDGCRIGELRFQRCTEGHAIFNPASVCRLCQSMELHWVTSSGRGVVYSWTTVWRAQTPAFRVPYVAALITLDEGFQMLANVIGCDDSDLHVDMDVAVEFHPISQRFWLPYFSPRRH